MAQAAVLVTRGSRIPGWLPLLLGFLQAVGPVSTDMYLPSFPALEAGLRGAPGSAQITLATWILGLSVGQLVVGTASDRFGRRTPLLIGTAVYTIASAGCALSDSIAVLAVWRFVAALGASASMIVPRAVVRDVAEGHDAARMMSRLILILGAAPILAPSLGGLVLGFASWRAIFWIMTGYGLIGSLLAMALLPDTLPPAARTHLAPSAMVGRYRLVLTDRQFMTHAAMLSCVSFALFAYLGGSPTVFIGHYHLPPGRYAILFGAIAGAYITGSQLNILVVRRFGLSGTLTIVSWAYLALGGLVLAAALTDVGGAVGLALALALMQGVIGFISPTATVGALKHHAAHAGSASAMVGTLQFLIGASSGFLIAWMTNGTALPMAWLMLAGAVGVKIADLCRPRC